MIEGVADPSNMPLLYMCYHCKSNLMSTGKGSQKIWGQWTLGALVSVW